MFSSNQVLEISGELGNKQLYRALKFALKKDGSFKCFNRSENNIRCVYQITDDGKFCIGWNPNNKLIEGWNEFQFDFNLKIISDIISEFLLKQDIMMEDFGDGSYDKGFLMKVAPETFSNNLDGVKNPSYNIVTFKVCTLFYSK